MTLNQATFVGPAGSIVLSQSDQLWAARGVLGEGGIDPSDRWGRRRR